MDKKQLCDLVKTLNPDAEVKEGRQYAEVTVAAGAYYSLAKALRENKESHFDFLVCLSGVDYGTELGVVCHLSSTKHGHMLVLKTQAAGRDNPVLDSLTDIWAAAEYQEREVYDLLGIRFNNHPDMRRLFLDSSWGYPLRKDYVDDINIVSK